jgi:FkbM family methyltransferase
MDFLRRILPQPVKNALRPIYHFFIWTLKNLIRGLFKGLGILMGQNRFLSALHFVSNEIDTIVEVENIKFEAGDQIPHHRAKTLMTKEPDTINWIDDFIEEGDIFYDVGANIGVFSVYAAMRKKAKVYAFEPLAANYGVLNQNIHLNALSGQVTALCLALHNKVMLSHLNVSAMLPGKAGHSFENPVGAGNTVFEPSFLQGMIGIPMDQFVRTYDAPFPNHVKIDVDANEPQVVSGMKSLLSDSRLKSIAIELNTDWSKHAEIIEIITASGFRKLEDDRYINHAYRALRPISNHFFVRADT